MTRILLNKGQLRILSGFFSDLAKGLVLASIIGQGFALEIIGIQRFAALFVWILIACIFLFIALYFSRRLND